MNREALSGAIGAGGLIAQIVIGLGLADSQSLYSALILPHMLIGITGIVLVAYLLSKVYFSDSNSVKALYLITFLVVMVQVALGFRILAVPDSQLAMGHLGGAAAILVLLGLSQVTASRKRGTRAVVATHA